jgi:acetyl-CoA carboxylase biotin carboxyl carrier protein
MPDEIQESFDLDKLQQLVEMMEKHDLREVRLRRGNERWLLRRGPQEVVQFAPAPAPAAMSAAPPAPPTAPAATPAGTAEITSPMVGTFYRSPSPGEKAFVKEGDRVERDSVVCLIEAMKFFNQIKAEKAGTITQILVNDGDAVDFGQPLFRIKPD